MHAIQALMLDEFEIINWVRYIDRFEFESASFGSSLLFIGMSTKLLLNNLRQKEAFEVYLFAKYPVFSSFNMWIMYNNNRF